ncbi:MAG: polymorphic toxin-type HINT domain-containing protein, partial [Thermogemmata sp.]
DYSPTLGRWTSLDPLRFGAGDVNLYRAIGNSLPNRLDPLGLFDFWDWLANRVIGTENVRSWDNVLGHHRTGWFAQTSNFSAGMGDTVSMGLTGRIRQWAGYDDVVDYDSGAYTGGQVAGTAVNVGLAFANPCAMTGTLANGARVINGVQAVGGALNAGDNLAAGNYGAATLDLVGVAGNSFQMLRPCFPGEVQVLTRRGWVRWDALTPADEVLSLPEMEPEGELAYRPVEEVFQRWGVIWEVAVGGRTIGTTEEHPFYVLGKGWTVAGELKPGDRIVGLDLHESVAVTALRLTGRQEKLYNLRVADYHTYFVGDTAWAFALWAHNSYDAPGSGLARNAPEGGGFAHGITAEEITAINRRFGGITTLTGDVSTVLANAVRWEGFWNKCACIIRDIAGRHMFNDANKRTAHAVVEELMRRNSITTGVSSDQIRKVIERVARGELREVEDIARALRGF